MKGRIFASEIWGAYFGDGLFFFVGRGGGGGGGLLSKFYGILMTVLCHGTCLLIFDN